MNLVCNISRPDRWGQQMVSWGVLLYAHQSGSMLAERSQMAARLWHHNVRAGMEIPLSCLIQTMRASSHDCCARVEYLYPSHLTQSTVQVYCREMGLRWLVLYRMYPFEQSRLIRGMNCCDVMQPYGE